MPSRPRLTDALVRKLLDAAPDAVVISLSPLETEEGLWVTSAIRDVTDRVQMAEELRLHRDRL
jgi:hypothetical protein